MLKELVYNDLLHHLPITRKEQEKNKKRTKNNKKTRNNIA